MKIFKTRDVKDPHRGSSGSAGIDIFIPSQIFVRRGDEYIDFGNKVEIPKGGSVLIAAGIKANVPEDHALIAFNKSGVAVKKGLDIGACVIDEDYTGEIHIHLNNVGASKQVINAGDKITQLLCVPVKYVPIEVVNSEEECFEDKLESSERGSGGFGSTGTT
jgi:dUTP pyrophosphatase